MTTVPGMLRRDMRASMPNRRWWRLPWALLCWGAIAVVCFALVQGLALRSFSIPSESMVPTLAVGDRLLVDELSPRLTGYHRGDVVVFPDPGNWVGPKYEPGLLQEMSLQPASGGYIVKRVIGLPGDHVQGFLDGKVLVNGHQFTVPSARVTTQTPFDVTLKAGQVWVMGDNRGNSADSRYHGPVRLDMLTGRAALVYFPFSDFGAVG